MSKVKNQILLNANRDQIEKNILQFTRKQKRPCVSIYLSAQGVNFTTAQRKLKLIRLLKQAEITLSHSIGKKKAKELTSKLWKSNPTRWIEESSHSLVIFHESELTTTMNIPIQLREQVVVSDTFHIKPVLSWLQMAPHYYLVSLSFQRVLLYEGTPWALNLIQTIEAPRNVAKANGKAKRSSSEGGQVDPSERIRQFFIQAERQIFPILKENRNPVVIAGVKRLHSIYGQINRDPDLLMDAIEGNVESWSRKDLKEAAFNILKLMFETQKKEIIAEYEHALHVGSATDDLFSIARAAIKGKVNQMVIASDLHLSGQIHPSTGELTLQPNFLLGAVDDVLDDLAEVVLFKGGKVVCLPSSELPTLSPAIAFVR